VAAHISPLDPSQPERIEGQALRTMCPSCHARYDARYKELRHQINCHQTLVQRALSKLHHRPTVDEGNYYYGG
jgi:hypothetical protein